jgi:glycine betaine/proline transport system permease protein
VLVALLALIGMLGLWDKLLQTLALVLVSTGLRADRRAAGHPAGRPPAGRRLLLPVLDVMQTYLRSST